MPTVHANFTTARKPTSPGGARVTKAEVQKIVREAREDGFQLREKRQLKKEMKVSKATPAATAEFKRLADKYGFARLSERLSDRGGSSSGGGVGGSSYGGGVGGASFSGSSFGGSVGGGS